MIQNGTKVKWKTRGYEPEKEGTIVAFIPKKESPVKVFPELEDIAQSRIKLGNGKTGGSAYDRYLVVVERSHARTGEPLDPDFYSPTVSIVEKQNGGVKISGTK